MKDIQRGDILQRFKGNNRGSPVGHTAVVRSIEWNIDNQGRHWVYFEDDTSGYLDSFHLIGNKLYDPSQQPYEDSDI